MVVAGSKQQQAMTAGCVMFPGRRGGDKIKREVDRLDQKWATRGTGLGHIEEMGYRI
jgi:hypothetical protein